MIMHSSVSCCFLCVFDDNVLNVRARDEREPARPKSANNFPISYLFDVIFIFTIIVLIAYDKICTFVHITLLLLFLFLSVGHQPIPFGNRRYIFYHGLLNITFVCTQKLYTQ